MAAKSYFLLDDKILPMDSEETGKLKPKRAVENQLLEGKTILVIDDNPINLIVAEKTLKKFGAKSTKALSAKEGIQKFISQPFDLVLMDLHMPSIDGFEATAMLRETQNFKSKPTTILAYTTYSRDEVKEKMDEYKFDGYIGKPFTQDQVLETIIKVLDLDKPSESK